MIVHLDTSIHPTLCRAQSGLERWNRTTDEQGTEQSDRETAGWVVDMVFID